MEEKISSELKLSELRVQGFRQSFDQLQDRASSLLLLTLQWKDLEDHFASSRNVIEQLIAEQHSIEESVQQKLEDVKKREKDLELVQESVRERCREIEAKEKDFELTQRKEIEERKGEKERIEKSRRELEVERVSIETKLREIKDAEEKLELFNDSIEKRVAEVRVRLSESEVKEKQCEKFANELKLKEEQLEERCKDLVVKEENFSRRILEFELKEKKLDEKYKELRVKNEKIDEKFNEFELKEKQIKARLEELSLKNEKIDKKFKELELKEEQITAQCKDVKSEKGKFVERCKELKVKERQLEEQCRELEVKEKYFVNAHNIRQKIEPPSITVVNNAVDYPMDAILHFSVNMDGKALQIFLNEHRGEYDSMRNEVLVALGFSSDPAKLVLDAMQGFYPSHLKKGDMEFEVGVVRRSCILLLEQLMKISPEIRPYVKKEAMELAFDWRTKVKGDAEHSLEVLGFLLLLASYGLASAFDDGDLLTQLEIVAKHSQAPELLRVLGFADKIFCFIQNLIRKTQQLEAIKFIYWFELVNDFPPVPLLEAYLKNSKIAVKRFRKVKKSLQGQTEATKRRIADLRCAVRCIEEFNIECRPLLGKLKQMIDALGKQISNGKTRLAALAPKKQENKKKHLPPRVSVADAPVAPKSASATSVSLISFPSTTSNSMPAPKTQSQKCSGSKHPCTAPSAKDVVNPCPVADQATCAVPFDAKVQQSLLGDSPLENKEASSSLDPQHEPKSFSFNKSKEDVRLLLNKHENNDLARGEIAAALRLACDPGKLVLDMINASYPFNLKANNAKLGVSEKKCILLLEQLRIVSPQINPDIKEEARKVALHWETILAKKKNYRLVIGFLQFLAAYGLPSTSNADKLLSLLDADEWRSKEAAELFQVLGLADMLPNFIQKLIEEEQQIEAVKYIYAFDMIDKIPPVPILKDYLSNSSKHNVEQLSKKKRKSIGGQIQAIDKELKALKAMFKCITDYKIDGLSSAKLKEQISQLLKQKEEKVQMIENSKAKIRPGSSCESNADLRQRSGNKRPRIHAEDPPRASSHGTSAVHSMRPPQPPPPGFFPIHGVPNMNPPRSRYSLAGYPPNYNMQLNSYNADVSYSYHWTHVNSGHRNPLPYRSF